MTALPVTGICLSLAPPGEHMGLPLTIPTMPVGVRFWGVMGLQSILHLPSFWGFLPSVTFLLMLRYTYIKAFDCVFVCVGSPKSYLRG